MKPNLQKTSAAYIGASWLVLLMGVIENSEYKPPVHFED
ncbi:MAG: hypothetical protein RL637_1148 [Pseudomonadota bacterium]|jgi:hypothetical protein